MSRFTLASLRQSPIKLISKYDPAIDWSHLNAEGIFFEVPKKPGKKKPQIYDAKKHTDLVVTLPGTKALVFYCHSPSVKERVTAFEMGGIEVDSNSGIKYIGPSGKSAGYAPGNGALVGLTSAYKSLAFLVIDEIGNVEVKQFRERNKYGLSQLSKEAIQAIAPQEGDQYFFDALDPIFVEIGSIFLNEDEDSGKS